MKKNRVNISVGACLVVVQSMAWAIGDKELASQVARQMDLDSATVEGVIETAKSTIVANLRDGEEVRLSNFGRFYKETRTAHEARNPGTGETVQVPDRAFLRFKPFDSGHEQLR